LRSEVISLRFSPKAASFLLMGSQPEVTSPPSRRDTRIGIIIRVAFFLAVVIIGLSLLSSFLVAVLGVVVAGTISLCATGLLANFLTMRIFDRRPLVDIGLQGGRSSVVNFALGVILGGGSAGLMLLAPLLAGTGHLVNRPQSDFTWPTLVTYLFALLIAATGEEMIFRGYAFQLLIEKIGPFATVLPVGVIFGLAHASNPNATIIGVLNTVLWGILLGYAFLRSHDLWLPIGLHYGWNAVLPLFGVNLSGLTIDVTRYSYRWDLTPLWSGGSYGPEGGLLTTIFAIALFFAIARTPVKTQIAYIARVLNDGV
jgi:membrane protease YdiL (CAAX protease family)